MDQPTGILLKSSPRFADFAAVFGEEGGCVRIPLESYLPVRGSAPGQQDKEFYKLDVKRLTDKQRFELVNFLQRRFRYSPVEIAIDLDGEHGLPILADDISVPIPLKYFV